MTGGAGENAAKGAAGVAVRDATAADAAAVADIYNEGIRGRGATFETGERSAGDVLAWLASPELARHPFLVAALEDGSVIGWVRASSYRTRECYRTIAEFSVYVAGTARGRGVGDLLMAEFVRRCAAAGVTKILSRIFPENRASLRLCARHGFREVGTYERHARLDGVWRDVVIVERVIPENMD